MGISVCKSHSVLNRHQVPESSNEQERADGSISIHTSGDIIVDNNDVTPLNGPLPSHGAAQFTRRMHSRGLNLSMSTMHAWQCSTCSLLPPYPLLHQVLLRFTCCWQDFTSLGIKLKSGV
jgi:hypothetical protein